MGPRCRRRRSRRRRGTPQVEVPSRRKRAWPSRSSREIQQLDRDRALESSVGATRQPHRPHAARAKRSFEGIAADGLSHKRCRAVGGGHDRQIEELRVQCPLVLGKHMLERLGQRRRLNREGCEKVVTALASSSSAASSSGLSVGQRLLSQAMGPQDRSRTNCLSQVYDRQYTRVLSARRGRELMTRPLVLERRRRQSTHTTHGRSGLGPTDA